MKKKILVTMMAATLAMSTIIGVAGCGKKEAEVPVEETQGVQVESTNTEVVVADVIPEETDENGEVLSDAVYNGRFSAYCYLPRWLVLDLPVNGMGSLASEKRYFDFLEDKWLDSSWDNENYADSIYYQDIFTAINNGLYEKMTATIADYSETEAEMANVYSDMVIVENQINEDYAVVALCDIAGFNGVHFTNETTINNAVTREVVCNTAAIFARDEDFYALQNYVDLGNENYAEGAEYFVSPATGYDVNYAFAVALGLDTANAYDELVANGYTVFDPTQEVISLIDYDKAVYANAVIYASRMNAQAQSVASTDNTESQTTSQPTESQTTQQPTGNGGNGGSGNGGNGGNGGSGNGGTGNGGNGGGNGGTGNGGNGGGNGGNGGGGTGTTQQPTGGTYNHPEAATMTPDEILAIMNSTDDPIEATKWAEDYISKFD